MIKVKAVRARKSTARKKQRFRWRWFFGGMCKSKKGVDYVVFGPRRARFSPNYHCWVDYPREKEIDK